MVDAIDVSIVLFRNSREQLFSSLATQSIAQHLTLLLFVQNNDPDHREQVEECIARARRPTI